MTQERDPHNRPLEGILVLTLEQAVAAPLCTCRLAEAGARVIKVERPEGDFARRYDSVANGESAYFLWLNHGKESLVLDLKTERDKALLSAILKKADILVENFKPGALSRLGFAPDALLKKRPDLIVCSISGYGSSPEFRERKAYDLLIQAESGLASITGAPEAPGRVGVSVADIAAGMYAYEAVLEALIARSVTGRGRHIEVSLFDALADWMTVPLLHYSYGGKAPERVGLRHPSIAPYGVYETADGRQILISIQNEREWVKLCEDALDVAALAADPRFQSNVARVKNRPLLEEAIQAAFRKTDFESAARNLERSGIAFAALNGVEELSKHPALRRMELETPSGPISLPATPARHNGQSLIPGPLPSLGQHSAAIREEFDFYKKS
ncbi:MAG: CaiB/BaiF CoA-transferase family protein [Kiloniellales bacterium]|nr:CaiB/BaiF CoA-transferase family protein [Kiloniellales bacterium]